MNYQEATVEHLRTKLNESIGQYGPCNPKTLKISEELDKLIINYYHPELRESLLKDQPLRRAKA